nr:PREDICTED: protein TIFY 5B-like [Raphanus sativus]
MEMQSNCDLELRLLPPPCDPSTSENLQSKQESQKMVIFYNGHVYVSSDLTHLQAKAILSLASGDPLSLESSDGSDPSTIPNILTRKASMKRSLRSFLQKRNVRIQASCPYQHSR